MSRDKAQNLCGCDLCGFNPCLFFQSFSLSANVWRIFPIWWSTKHYGNHQQTILYDPVCSCKDLRSALHVISKSPFLRPRTSCHRDSLGTEDWKVGHPSFKKNLFRSIPKRKRLKDMSSKGKGHIIIQTIHFLVQPFVFTTKSQQVFISWGSDPSTAEGPQQHRWQGHLLLKSGQMSAPYRVREHIWSLCAKLFSWQRIPQYESGVHNDSSRWRTIWRLGGWSPWGNSHSIKTLRPL